MKRLALDINEIASLNNLTEATHRAASGKRHRPEVVGFLNQLDVQLAALSRSILEGTLTLGENRTFEIRDPKPRTIVAPCFRERVLHHALMAQLGPVLDNALPITTSIRSIASCWKPVQSRAISVTWTTSSSGPKPGARPGGSLMLPPISLIVD